MEKEKGKVLKKKKHLKWQIKLIIFIIFSFTFIYFFGTKGIFIKEYKIETKKIESSMHGLKIVQFSDTHFNSNTNLEKIKKLVNKINKTKPDIVIFTGDLIDKNYQINEDEKNKLKEELTKINAELGKYYIAGDEDFNDANLILNSSSFVNINENKELIYKNSNKPIMLAGKNTLNKDIANNNENIFKILLLHNPNDINDFKDLNIDLVLSGHTLNGIINIPKVKELFINGNFYNTYQKVNNTKLFINPGIGTKKINIRIFNHPTIYLFRLNKKN